MRVAHKKYKVSAVLVDSSILIGEEIVMMKKMICAAPLVLMCAFVHAEQPASQWQFVNGSDSKDFQIQCLNGNIATLIIGRNGRGNEYQVARNIYFLPQENNTTVLRFQRGFVRADTDMTYISSVNERCEITER